jgi:hypothetical protein
VTAPTLASDILEDSSRLIALLEQHRQELPFVEEALVQHRKLHSDLLHQQHSSQRALDEWRRALARRWQCEVAGRRRYLEIQRQLIAHFGADAPELLLFLRGSESNSSAAELLTDLRRLHAALSVTASAPAAAVQELAALTRACADLEDAIARTNRCDEQRHKALLDRNLSQHAYQHLGNQTRRQLSEHLGREAIWAGAGAR